ncbi:MAG: TerB family tellurite resistance protein [Alphaproteobacteria bacterium]|nr:TerB family tellurite resistance protein [Alphaproteobacteria bacterium]
MFDAISRLFAQPRSEDDAPPDAKLSVATLLVHLAAVDGVVTDNERDTITGILTAHFGLAGDEVKRLVAEATRRDADSVDFYKFTAALSRLDETERLAIIRLMWQVVYADGQNHELEDNMVWRVAELIGISTRQRTVLRKQIRGGAGD